MISNIFQTILVHPLLNALIFVYNYIPDIGVAIILVTLVVRFALLPSYHKSLKHQKALQALQPKMNEIKEKYKDDQQKQAAAMMELYRVHKVNPMSSCLPLLIQLPIFFALFAVFNQSLGGKDLVGLYSFVPRPDEVSPMFLGIMNLADHNLVLSAIAGILQFFQTKMMLPKTIDPKDMMSTMMSGPMLYALPVITVVAGMSVPAGLPLYWIVTTLFIIVQQYFIIKKEAKEALAK